MKKIIFLLLLNLVAYSQTYNLSNSFGINGIVQTENTTEPTKTIFTTDNEILTTGFVLSQSPNPNLITHTIIIKLNENGVLDSTFGNNGITQTNIDFKDIPSEVVYQNNNKILVGGMYSLQNPLAGIYPNSP